MGGICTNKQGVNDESSAASIADVSTATFIAGGALVAVGTVLFLVGRHPASDASPPAAAARVEPVLGAGYAGLRGAW